MKTKKSTKRVIKKVAKKGDDYTVTVSVMGRPYKTTGKTLDEAIGNLKPGIVTKSKTVMTITSGKGTKERVLSPFMVNRLFNLSPTMRQVATKQVSILFDL